MGEDVTEWVFDLVSDTDDNSDNDDDDEEEEDSDSSEESEKDWHILKEHNEERY